MKILVLCHGNINRSPFTAAALRQMGLPADEVHSAGFVRENVKASKKCRDHARRVGITEDLALHRSKLVGLADLVWADLIIYMDNGNRHRLGDLTSTVGHPEFMGKSRCLAEFHPDTAITRIADPAFISDQEMLVKVFDQMRDCARELATMIAEGKKVL